MSEIGPFPYKHTPLSPDSSKREPYLSLDQNRFPPLTYSEYRETKNPLFMHWRSKRKQQSVNNKEMFNSSVIDLYAFKEFT